MTRPWYRKSRKRWFATLDGKQIDLGVTDPRALGDAWNALRAILAGNPGKTADPRTVAELVPEYLDAVRHRLAPPTQVKYAAELGWLVAQHGLARPADLVPADVERSAARERWSDSHRANVLYTVQAFARWCGATAFKVRRPPKESRGADSVIPVEVYERILRETTGDFHQYVRTLWHTGARPSEVRTLTVAGVDWANSCAVIRRHKAKKKGKVRTVHFSPECLALLAEQRRRYGDGLLFRGQGGGEMSVKAIVTRFIRLSEKVGHHTTAYMFRHTFATRALEAGVSDTQVAALMGHSSTAMIHKHYSHISANARLLRDVAAKLDEKKDAA